MRPLSASISASIKLASMEDDIASTRIVARLTLTPRRESNSLAVAEGRDEPDLKVDMLPFDHVSST